MKIIVTDLDNTLLRTDKTISEYTISVLEKCRKQGNKIVFATARSSRAASRITDLFKPDIFIGYGGALISDMTGKVIKRFEISKEISSALISDCISIGEIYGIYTINENTALTNNIELLNMKDYSHYGYCNFSQGVSEGFLKISTDSTDRRVVEELGRKYPMLDLLHYSGEPLSRFANKNAVKWKAIKIVAEYLGISTKDFIAFGDDFNDLEMIENCGIGVAVSNAVEKVKMVADCICGSNDNDGVADWIEKLL